MKTNRLSIPAHIYYSQPYAKWLKDEPVKAYALENSFVRRTSPYASDEPRRDKDKIYIEHFESLGPRWVKDAHEVARLGHTGWYTDDFQGSTLIGVVLNFSRKDRFCFLAGTRHSDWDGVTVDSYIHDDEKDAARAADSMAQYDAEEYQEAERKDRLENDISELTHSLEEDRLSLRDLLREYNVLKRKVRAKTEDMFDSFKFQSPVLCNALEAQIKKQLRDMGRNRKRLQKMKEGDYDYGF